MKSLVTSLALILGTVGTASAQFVQVYSPPVFAPAPTVAYYPAPAVQYSYYPPAQVSYYPPAQVSYYQPAQVAYSAPVMAYSAPVVAYSPPVMTYSAPVVAYSAPAPGTYTIRQTTGYGIFRPRGVTTESYYTPYYPR